MPGNQVATTVYHNDENGFTLSKFEPMDSKYSSSLTSSCCKFVPMGHFLPHGQNFKYLRVQNIVFFKRKLAHNNSQTMNFMTLQ